MRFPCPPFRAFNKQRSLGSGRNFVLILRGTKSPNSCGSRGEWKFLLDGAPEELHDEEEEEGESAGHGDAPGHEPRCNLPGPAHVGQGSPSR